jgi:hypothetical protein
MSNVGRRRDEAIGVTNVIGKGRGGGMRWRTRRRETCIVKVFEIISSRVGRAGGRRVYGGIKWARLYMVVVIVIFEGRLHFIVQERVSLCVGKGGVSNGHEKGKEKGKDKEPRTGLHTRRE